MRVLLINPGLRHVLPQLRFMAASGIDVHCVNLRPGARLDSEGITNYDWHAGEQRSSGFEKLAFLRQGVRARRFTRWLKPDIVHAHYATSAGLVAYLSGYHPYVVTIHGSDLLLRGKSRLGRAILSPVLRNADCVNPVAEHMTGLLRHLGVDTHKTLALTFGVDLQELPFVPCNSRFDGGVRLLCTRSLGSPVYDIPTLLFAVAKARSRGCKVTLTLAATGSLSPSLTQLAGDLGISDAVTFGKGYSIADLPALMRCHDVYVSSSLSDGASISLMEAMACGIFPIVSDIPANTEWLEHGRNALLFPTGDADRLAELICQLPSQLSFVEAAVKLNRTMAEDRADQMKNLGSLIGHLRSISRARPRA